MLHLLRDRPRFRLLYVADAFSMLGDWLTYVAVGLLALRGPQGVFGVALVYAALDVGATSLASAAGGIGAALLSLYVSPLVTAGVIVGLGLVWLAVTRSRALVAAAFGRPLR